MAMQTGGVPQWLAATWTRTYIRRALAEDDKTLGDKDSSVSVIYLQTLADGHSFDLRIANDFSLGDSVTGINDLSLEQLQKLASGAVEAFSGGTRAEQTGENEWLFKWHAAFLFPPQLGNHDDPASVLSAIAAGQHETSDVGRAIPVMHAPRMGLSMPRQ